VWIRSNSNTHNTHRYGPDSDEEVGGRAAGCKRAGLYCSDEGSDAEGVSSRSCDYSERDVKKTISTEPNANRRRLLKKTHGHSDSEDEQEVRGDGGGGGGFKGIKFGVQLPGTLCPFS